MDLAPTAEQRELQASARRFLETEVTRERLLSWDKAAEGYDPGFWRGVAELGWIGFSLPETHDGGGGSLLDAALILEECGRALAPPAIHSAIVGARALAALGGKLAEAELPSLARGERQVTLAVHEPEIEGDFSLFRTRVENGRLSGEKWYVRQGPTADWLVVAARDGEMPALYMVPAGARGVARRDLKTFSDDRQSVFTFDRVAVDPQARLASGDGARRALRRVRNEAVALALGEMVGGFAAVVDMTVAYMKERIQFGQPLGKFQAVQFRCADMATSLAAMRYLAFQAIWRLATGLDAGRELALARAWCGGAYKQATLDAHQLHGGAGYVVEHPLHRYSERAQGYAILFAGEDGALEEVARRILD
jgi:alkylation response protein AidB-like acyl-CoA dehydrogenase